MSAVKMGETSAARPLAGAPRFMGARNRMIDEELGSGLIDHSQNMTAAAMQIAEK
jgi:hypothetical protein